MVESSPWLGSHFFPSYPSPRPMHFQELTFEFTCNHRISRELSVFDRFAWTYWGRRKPLRGPTAFVRSHLQLPPRLLFHEADVAAGQPQPPQHLPAGGWLQVS